MKKQYTQKQLSEELGVSIRSLQRYLQMDMPNPNEEGISLSAARCWIEERNALSSDSPVVMANGLTFTKEQIFDLKGMLLMEQCNHTKLKAKLDEIKIQIETKELVPAFELEQSLTKVLQPLRQMLLNLPNGIAHKVNPDNPTLAKELLESAINKILDDVQKLKKDYVT